MEKSSQKIAPKRLKSFVRHVCIIAKKHKDREKARIELRKQMQRLKRFSSKKREMDEELKELDRKISLVLEKEAKLLGIEQGESIGAKELMKEVEENRERIKQMNDSIDELRKKIEDYINIKMARDRKIQELEAKIRGKVRQKKEISSLKNKLKKLEAMYDKLKSKGVDVAKVADRIEDLKMRLSLG